MAEFTNRLIMNVININTLRELISLKFNNSSLCDYLVKWKLQLWVRLHNG